MNKEKQIYHGGHGGEQRFTEKNKFESNYQGLSESNFIGSVLKLI